MRIKWMQLVKQGLCGQVSLAPKSNPVLPRGITFGNPLQYSCLENPHGQRRLAKCSPWGRKGVEHDLATKQHSAQSHVLDT